MTTRHAKSNAREGDGVADDLAVVQAILRDEEGWSGRERQALTAAIAAMQAQQGAEPVAWVAFNAEGKPTDLAWWEDSVRRRMSEGGSVSPLIVPATGAPR